MTEDDKLDGMEEMLLDLADVKQLKELAHQFPKQTKKKTIQMINVLPEKRKREKIFLSRIKESRNRNELVEAIDNYVEGYD